MDIIVVEIIEDYLARLINYKVEIHYIFVIYYIIVGICDCNVCFSCFYDNSNYVVSEIYFSVVYLYNHFTHVHKINTLEIIVLILYDNNVTDHQHVNLHLANSLCNFQNFEIRVFK